MPVSSTSLKLPPPGSFGRKAIFRQDTMSALTSSVKLYDFNKKDLLSAEDYVSGWFGFTVLVKGHVRMDSGSRMIHGSCDSCR